MEMNKSNAPTLCDQHNYDLAGVKIESCDKLDEIINNDQDSFPVPVIIDTFTLNPCRYDPVPIPLVNPNSEKLMITTPSRRSKRLEHHQKFSKQKIQDESQSLSEAKKTSKKVKMRKLPRKIQLSRSKVQEERIKLLKKELTTKEDIILAQQEEISTIGEQLKYVFRVAVNLEDQVKSLKLEKQKIVSELRRAFQKFLKNRAGKHSSHHSGQARKELKIKSEINNEVDTIIYTCIYCAKNFNFKSKLISHIRSHTGERPFSCKFCNIHYKYKDNLINHLWRKHGKSG